MNLCPICGPDNAPRPTGAATYTHGGITHKTRECAALASAGETVTRTDDGYRAESGRLSCLECFNHGQPHTYSAGEDPHEGGHDPRRRHDLPGRNL